MNLTPLAVAYVLGIATIWIIQAYRAFTSKTATPGQPVVTALTPVVGDLATWASTIGTNGAHQALDAAIAALTQHKATLPATTATVTTGPTTTGK